MMIVKDDEVWIQILAESSAVKSRLRRRSESEKSAGDFFSFPVVSTPPHLSPCGAERLFISPFSLSSVVCRNFLFNKILQSTSKSNPKDK